jgi:hypothetical protein
MDTLSIVVAVAAAVGVGLTANWLFTGLGEIFQHLFKLRRSNALKARLEEQKTAGQVSEAEVLGIAHIPWGNYYAIAAFVGLVLLALLAQSNSVLRFAVLALPALVYFARQIILQHRRRAMIWKVRNFLIDLRLHMTIHGSLLMGLISMSRDSLAASPVYDRLRSRLRGASAESGLSILKQMAEDLRSPEFTRAVQQLEAAQVTGGVQDLDAAVAKIIGEIDDEVGYRSEEQMQRLPMRLTLIAMPFLLAPIVILLFYPLVARVIQTLSGVSVGGGF